MEVFGPSERLPDQARADGLAILLDDLAVGAIAKERLRKRSDRERIDHSKDRGSNQSEPDGNEQILFHGLP
jgi:hypothetical protein